MIQIDLFSLMSEISFWGDVVQFWGHFWFWGWGRGVLEAGQWVVCPPKRGSQSPKPHHPKTAYLSPVCLNSDQTRSYDTLVGRGIVIGYDNFPCPHPLQLSAIFSSSSSCGACQSPV